MSLLNCPNCGSNMVMPIKGYVVDSSGLIVRQIAQDFPENVRCMECLEYLILNEAAHEFQKKPGSRIANGMGT